MSWQVLASMTLMTASTLAGPDALAENPCSRTSAAHTVALVELYTSEGCSSCPPADRWLRALADAQSADRIVPLALHVDYWDYIGWKDPYAQARFSSRQRRLASLAGTRMIYTPEVFVAQRELRGWSDPATFARRVQEVNRQPARADITIGMQPSAGRGVAIEASFEVLAAERARSQLQGVVVVYEDGLVSAVHRGENEGVTLRHDRVVRWWSPLTLVPGGEPQRMHENIALGPDWNAANLGVAAFVEDLHSGEVLQALSLPGCQAAER